jgi:hypothetical protein
MVVTLYLSLLLNFVGPSSVFPCRTTSFKSQEARAKKKGQKSARGRR